MYIKLDEQYNFMAFCTMIEVTAFRRDDLLLSILRNNSVLLFRVIKLQNQLLSIKINALTSLKKSVDYNIPVEASI